MKYVFIACFLLIPAFLFAQTSREKAIRMNSDTLKNGWTFTEKWRFTPYDNPEYALLEYNDSRWDTLSPLFPSEETAKKRKYKVYPGIGWLRYYFTIDTSLVNKPLSISIVQSGASDIYLDGKLLLKVGKIKGKDRSEYINSKITPYIFSIRDTGLHVFAVRYENYHAQKYYDLYNDEYGGFYLTIHKANSSVARQIYAAEIITLITILIAGVFVALSLVHFLLYLFYRASGYNLFFSLFNLSISLLSYTIYLKTRTEDPLLELRASNAMFFIACLLCFSITGFVNNLFAKNKLRFKILASAILAVAVLRFLHPVTAYISTFLLFVVVVIEAFVIIIIAIAEKVKGAWIVGFGFLFLTAFIFTVFIIAAINGGLSFENGTVSEMIFLTISIIAIVSVPISISAYLAWQFASVSKDLQNQLKQVRVLSEKTLLQEQEKKVILENQNEKLEKEVALRTEEIKHEKQKSDDLLLNILPAEIAEELKTKGESKAQQYDEVSVLFTDFVNFTKISEQLGVDDLLNELNINFTAFDKIMEKHGLEKIKTIGDAYLAVSGLPIANARHAQNAVNAAIDIMTFVENRKREVPYGLDIRIGINSGSLIAGIIGVKKFAYDIWGDTVNTAARMEQSSEPGKINISENTYKLVKDEFSCTHRGKIDAKNKGVMDMYFIQNK